MVPDVLLVTYLVKGTACLVAVALLLGARPKLVPVGLVAAAAVVLFAGLLWGLFPLPQMGFDYRIFWAAGQDVRAGRDPYADRPLIHPPTALPLFALFALAPFGVSFLVWTVLNALACLLLLPLSQGALLAQEQAAGGGEHGRDFAWRLPPLVLVGLTPALLLSEASLVSFYLGQLGILEAVLLLAALHSQARGRPVLAGLWLALATVKVTTMLPFLLLFHRKADRRTWVALPVAVLGLCLVSGNPADLPGRLATIRARIKELESPGKVNDYSFDGTRSENMLGFDHAFYRLGLRDRGVIRAAQLAALAVLGGWVASQVLRKDRLPRAAACSLVALYSVVFLYHRTYDTPVLALPFVYCAGRARSVRGRRRYAFVFCAVAILLVWHLYIGFVRDLQRHSLGWGPWGRLVQAAVLPYATWLVVLAMIALVIGARRPAPAR
jgi:hypothetical protein